MIIKLILIPFWLLVDLIISLFPESSSQAISYVINSDVLGIGLYFLPLGYWSLFVGTLLFWFNVKLIWAVVVWTYKKIPGVN